MNILVRHLAAAFAIVVASLPSSVNGAVFERSNVRHNRH